LRLDGTDRPRILIVFSLDATTELGVNTEANVLAAMCFQIERPCHLVVFTGGIFNREKGQYSSAARMMQEFWKHHFVISHQAGLNFTPSTMIEEGSKTTRQNIANVFERLAKHGYNLQECDVYVVSERWHLVGIDYLFRRLYNVRVERISSNFRESLAGICGRAIRLILYRIDPKGTGWLSRRKIRQ